MSQEENQLGQVEQKDQKKDKVTTDAKEYYNKLEKCEKEKLEKIVYYIIGKSHQLTEEHITDLFNQMKDEENSEKITKADLEDFLKDIIPPNEIQFIIEKIRKSFDDEIDIQKFKEYMKKNIKGDYKKDDITELKEVFQLFDTDHDNKITKDDIYTVMNVLGETDFKQEMCEEMIKHLSSFDLKKNKEKYDTNPSISYEEFINLVYELEK